MWFILWPAFSLWTDGLLDNAEKKIQDQPGRKRDKREIGEKIDVEREITRRNKRY